MAFSVVLLYISFFPQLIAGPIVRWKEIEGQLAHRKQEEEQIVCGIERFVKGLFKKLVFANGLGLVADRIFALQIQDYSMGVAWLGAVCYALQIFYDFSGYSDMAIGLAAMFGFRFQENFNHPYSGTSIHDFWRRWHISLSLWFREYVYIPLGGNRAGRFSTERNKMIVFLLTGIWHGANWTFVLWGLWHGILNVLEDTILPVGKCPLKWLGNLYTWLGAVLGFVMFRADSVSYGWQMIRAMFFNTFMDLPSKSFLLEQLSPYVVFLLAGGILFSYPVTHWLGKKCALVGERYPRLWQGCRYGAVFLLLVACLCSLAAASYNPFIYFRF